ncbi:hypothetical protein D917_08129 [Trichinella nativa]|uniref:Uncharacterized protein n=1 Tax=Trichinella nativa TaxID=6335 RepID=A0A1Y3EL79_9BILA|nr:hypothetical protein D917_08129 [Trichinella nativa]
MVRQSCLSLRTAMTDHVTCIQKRNDQKYFEIVTQSLVAFVGAAVFHVRDKFEFFSSTKRYVFNMLYYDTQIYSLQVIYVLVSLSMQQEQPNVQNSSVPMKQREER